jgi:uroporphyrin-III C-methyltransferase/precorrin-2 dehydrogenase/sirohydrochlorin ferrochelatase
VLTTGVTRPGDPAPDWASLVRSGSTLAFYMSVAAAPELEAALLGAGAPPASRVEIVAEAGTARARTWRVRLAGLGETIAREGVRNPAVILVRLPKRHREIAGIAA